MKSRQNYYRILHVQPDAPQEIIKASYRTILMQLQSHPDLGGSHAGAVLLNEAYAVLGDPGRRAQYDLELRLQEELQQGKKQESGHSGGAPRGPGPNPSATQEETRYPGQKSCVFCGAPYWEPPTPQPEDLCGRCGSPLHHVVRVRGESECRRLLQRMPKGGEVVFYSEWPGRGGKGWIRDLSAQGMCFKAAQPFPRNQIIKMDSSLLGAVGRVVYCRKARRVRGFRYVIGVEFVTLAFQRVSGTFVSKSA